MNINMQMSGDRRALEELERISKTNVEHEILHYLYFRSKKNARMVTKIIKKEGYHVLSGIGADGINWLVLVKQLIIPTEETVFKYRTFFEHLAEKYAGEYDGWEVKVLPVGAQN